MLGVTATIEAGMQFTDYNITMHKGGVDHKPLQSRPDDVPERRVL
jgi:hypothetical protein